MRSSGIHAASALLLALGCLGTAGPVVAATDNALLAERVVERWNALIAGDWNRAYEMLTPGFRATTTYEQWRSEFGSFVKWQDVSIRHIDCAEELNRCNVRLWLTYTVSLPQFGIKNMSNDQPIDETWLEIDGDWWYFPR